MNEVVFIAINIQMVGIGIGYNGNIRVQRRKERSYSSASTTTICLPSFLALPMARFEFRLTEMPPKKAEQSTPACVQ